MVNVVICITCTGLTVRCIRTFQFQLTQSRECCCLGVITPLPLKFARTHLVHTYVHMPVFVFFWGRGGCASWSRHSQSHDWHSCASSWSEHLLLSPRKRKNARSREREREVKRERERGACSCIHTHTPSLSIFSQIRSKSACECKAGSAACFKSASICDVRVSVRRHRHRDRHRHRQTQTQTDTHTHIHTDTYRQTHTHTQAQTQTDTDTHTHTGCLVWRYQVQEGKQLSQTNGVCVTFFPGRARSQRQQPGFGKADACAW